MTNYQHVLLINGNTLQSYGFVTDDANENLGGRCAEFCEGFLTETRSQ